MCQNSTLWCSLQASTSTSTSEAAVLSEAGPSSEAEGKSYTYTYHVQRLIPAVYSPPVIAMRLSPSAYASAAPQGLYS